MKHRRDKQSLRPKVVGLPSPANIAQCHNLESELTIVSSTNNPNANQTCTRIITYDKMNNACLDDADDNAALGEE